MTPQIFIELYHDRDDPEEPLTARRYEWDGEGPVDGSAEVTPVQNLDDLTAALTEAEVSEYSEYPLEDLPTFGGEEPTEDERGEFGVMYSWDEERALIDDGEGGFAIEERA